MAEPGPSTLPRPSVIYSGNDNQGFELGYNSGTVNNYWNAHSQIATPTKPKPFSNIPFKRNPDFVDRDGMLNKIKQELSEPAARVALVGLGGIGKSQLAIEYCYLVREASPTTYVFWVHASNEARFQESFRDIAVRLKLSRRDETGQRDVLLLVKDWLVDEENGPWILVVDNADDPAVFFAKDRHEPTASDDRAPTMSKDLADFLPQSGHGKVIITSRYEKVALRLVQGPHNVLRVSPMTRKEALDLLRKKMAVGHDDESYAADLVEALDFIPLAIDQACAYIMQRKPRTSIPKYLEDFRSGEAVASALLIHDPGNIFRDGAASSSILATWKVSWDYIRSDRPSAVRLLSLMSYFNCQGVPDFLLCDYRAWYMYDASEIYCLVNSYATSVEPTTPPPPSELSRIRRTLKRFSLHRRKAQTQTNCKPDPNSPNIADLEVERNPHAGCKHTAWSNRMEFEDDVDTLRNFSLISTNVDESTFQMHPLVQLASRNWLNGLKEAERWKDMSLVILAQEFPLDPYYNDWETCKMLLPHVDIGADAPPRGYPLHSWANLLTSVAYYMDDQGSYRSSEEAASKVLEAFEQHGDELFESQIAPDLKRALAWLLTRNGKALTAERILHDMLENQSGIFDENDMETVKTMRELARVLRATGNLDEAEDLSRKVTEISSTILGEESQYTITNMAEFGQILREKGNFEEALNIFRVVREKFEKLEGKKGPNTVLALHDLGITLRECGQFEESESLLEEALSGTEELFGADSSKAIEVVVELGILYWKQKRFEEAEAIFRKALECHERKIGKEHSITRDAKHNLVLILSYQRKWDAIADLDSSLTTEEWYGKEHEDGPTT